MNYSLGNEESRANVSAWRGLRQLLPLLSGERRNLIFAFAGILINAGCVIAAPLIVGHAIDTYLVRGNYTGLVWTALQLASIFALNFWAGVVQTRIMGNVGQRLLFRLRGLLFERIQELPFAFFGQNKAGDLISRINNDTDKLNQFFSRSLIQFVSNSFVIVGAGIAMLVVNARLGFAALVPALFLLVVTRLTSGWIKRQNAQNLKALGTLSAEVQESLDNFRVIAAFNRQDYFKKRFAEVNAQNYKAAVGAGIANVTYMPIFTFVANIATLIVVAYGLHLISQGQLTVGILISYIAYVNRFYDPLRQIASIWTDLQTAMAGWERISQILHLRSDLPIDERATKGEEGHLLQFGDVSFRYPGGEVDVLQHINLTLERGKTYALVGPTGGGKSTTAALMARLHDPTEGDIWLLGRNLRSFAPEVRAQKIGFILQDPFLFSGTIYDNLVYGNSKLAKLSSAKLTKKLDNDGLTPLLERFEDGLATKVDPQMASISLGQKQLIAFLRAVLREPELLILDEATANIDTVTERLLDEALQRVAQKTTIVIIAHRLNTIEAADQIFFINAGKITPAGSLDHAVTMLKKDARTS